MLTFTYTARSGETGGRVKSTVEAQNEQEAAKLIRSQGLTPIDIRVQGGELLGDVSKRFNRVRAKDRVLFARQLSTLINAGIPLVQALRSVNDQTTSKSLKIVINDLIIQVEAGTALSVAMSKHPDVFNQVFVSLIAAGETSGTLDTALERIAIQQEKDADIISKVRGAMIYPIIVLLVMLAVVTFMLVKVLPQVQVLYTSFPGANLPIETRVLLSTSHFVIKFWWLVLVILGLLVFFGTRYARTITGKRLVDKIKISAGPLGKLFTKMYMARFARTAATLVSAGVPLLQVLQITANAVSNVYVHDAITRASDKVKGGKALSDALAKEPYILPLVPSMIHIGEDSGSLDKMLSKCADYYEKEVDDEIKNISSIIEPIMMVLLGIIALIIVAAVLLPVYQLAGSGAISGGGI